MGESYSFHPSERFEEISDTMQLSFEKILKQSCWFASSSRYQRPMVPSLVARANPAVQIPIVTHNRKVADIAIPVPLRSAESTSNLAVADNFCPMVHRRPDEEY